MFDPSQWVLCSIIDGWWLCDAVLRVLQSRPGMPGLDAFQLTDIMMRLTRKEMSIPNSGDDLADFQQFVASGKLVLATPRVCTRVGVHNISLACWQQPAGGCLPAQLHVNVSHLLCCACCVPSGSAAVYGWMLERMPTMKSVQICNALFAMGKLNLYNAELCDALLQVRGRKVVQCAQACHGMSLAWQHACMRLLSTGRPARQLLSSGSPAPCVRQQLVTDYVVVDSASVQARAAPHLCKVCFC
jgi:hypothetical protein